MNNFLVKKLVYTASQMSDLQFIAAYCAMFICVSIVLFTFLIMWVIGREYVNKFNYIMEKYPRLNKIFYSIQLGQSMSVFLDVYFLLVVFM